MFGNDTTADALILLGPEKPSRLRLWTCMYHAMQGLPPVGQLHDTLPFALRDLLRDSLANPCISISASSSTGGSVNSGGFRPFSTNFSSTFTSCCRRKSGYFGCWSRSPSIILGHHRRRNGSLLFCFFSMVCWWPRFFIAVVSRISWLFVCCRVSPSIVNCAPFRLVGHSHPSSLLGPIFPSCARIRSVDQVNTWSPSFWSRLLQVAPISVGSSNLWFRSKLPHLQAISEAMPAAWPHSAPLLSHCREVATL